MSAVAGEAFAGRGPEIVDPRDPRVDLYRDSRDADLRGRHGLFLVESETCLRRWLEGVARRRRGERLPPALEVHSLLVTAEVAGRLGDLAARAGVESMIVADRGAIERISGFEHHHGALGLGRRPSRAEEVGNLDAFVTAIESATDEATGAADAARGAARPLPPGTGTGARAVVVTDGVVHVDNMGSIFRNAAALGAAGVLLSPRCADPLVRKSIRISVGHVFAVPWAVAADLPAALRALKARGWRVAAAENARDAVDLEHASFAARTAIVFGAEGHGISAAVLAEADQVCRIPSRAGAPLNVAVASAIVLHEVGRADRRSRAG